MTNTKTWWQSKTVWASLVAIIAGVVSLAGIDLDAKMQDGIVNLILAAADLAAGIIALIGRLQADTRIVWRQS